jgi:hypothetical protein
LLQSLEALAVVGLVGRGQTISLKSVGEIIEGSKGSAWLEGSKSFMEGAERNGHGCGFGRVSTMASAGAMAVVDSGRVEVLANCNVVGVHLGNGEGRLDSLVGKAVVVVICEGLGMGAWMVVGVKGGMGGSRRVEWDREGVGIKVVGTSRSNWRWRTMVW